MICKYKSTIILCIFLSGLAKAQIFPDRHTTNAFDAWISCTKSPNPNTNRGNTHWIMYEFAQASNLWDMTIWNLNHPDYIMDGLNKVIVETSSDGTSWTMVDTFTFPKAPGSGFYEGFHGPDLEGVLAKYLLITPISNHGGGCYGLSEVRIYTSDQENNELEFSFYACENDGIQLNLNGGVAQNGIYSGIGVTDNGDQTFNYDVDKVGPGTHEIKYTYGATTLTGEITVLPCIDPVCQECEQCNPADILNINGPTIPTDIYNGYKILADGQVMGNADVRFMTKNSAELNAGFQVNQASNFLVDFRTCYDNLLQNSDFESGSSPWTLSQHSGATATFSIDNVDPYEGNHSAKVVVNNTNGTDWHIQLAQATQTLVAGKTYRFSFAARTNTGVNPMAVILQLNSSPWTVYADEDFLITTNWEVYAFEFTAEETVTSSVGVRALLAATPNQTFWIDNFKYIQLD